MLGRGSPLAFALGVLLCACTTQRDPVATEAPAVTRGADSSAGHAGTWSRIPQAPRVGRYVSSKWSFSTVSYWLEGDDGVVLVDTQFLPSAAEELVEIAERETGKPVVTAIVLHANPDKFNGTAVLQARGIEVLTSAQVLAKIPEIHEKRVAAFGERYAPDYPTVQPQPASFGDADVTLERAGLRLRLHVLGPGCSGAHVALWWEGHLFVGDLVANGAHSWMELGLSDEWLARIDELAALQPTHVHPGRGGSGGAELLTAQAEYLRRVQALVSAEHAALTAGGRTPRDAEVDEAQARVRAAIEREHPGYGFAVFLRIGLPAEWRRAAAAATGS
jgi:glyoxylase-like metal-dependent hydrolase (beta-lactamase superfamily II)